MKLNLAKQEIGLADPFPGFANFGLYLSQRHKHRNMEENKLLIYIKNNVMTGENQERVFLDTGERQIKTSYFYQQIVFYYYLKSAYCCTY